MNFEIVLRIIIPLVTSTLCLVQDRMLNYKIFQNLSEFIYPPE